MTDDIPPSPWTQSPPPQQQPAPSPVREELARHEMLVSVGLGMLLGGGVVLLLGALFIMLS